MPDPYKGIPSLYDTLLNTMDNSPNFYEWMPNSEIYQKGQIVSVPAWFEKKKRWLLIDGHYDSMNEPESTWKAREFNTSVNEVEKTYVKKYFQIEKGENLVVTHGKKRPAKFLNYYHSDWFNPINQRQHVDYGLIIPLFSYKERHNQIYVLHDQAWENPSRIYIPSQYDEKPGVTYESSLHFHAIQMANVDYIEPLKCLDTESRMNKPFKLSEIALKLITFHYIASMNIFDGYFSSFVENSPGENDHNDYHAFKELLQDEINSKIEELNK